MFKWIMKCMYGNSETDSHALQGFDLRGDSSVLIKLVTFMHQIYAPVRRFLAGQPC